MDSVNISKKVNYLTEKVGQKAVEEKLKAATFEQQINSFLDRILDLQLHLNTRSESIEDISENLQKITWLNQKKITERDLVSINKLVAISRDFHQVLFDNYSVWDSAFRPMAVCNNQLDRLEAAIEDLSEDAQTLEEIFIFQPNDKELQKIISEFQFS